MEIPQSRTRTSTGIHGPTPRRGLLRTAVSLGWLLTWTAGPVFAGTLAQMRTAFGDLEVELFDRDKPSTVRNFIRYVESGRWQDMFVHRCATNFVVQGGGFRVLNPGTAEAMLAAVEVFGRVPNEFAVGPRLSNTYGTIAMAKLPGDTNSASSQWFINLKDNPFLDAEDDDNLFTVFGRVVRGTNVLGVFNRFNQNGATNVILDLRLELGHLAFGEMPLLTTNLTYNDLIYVDVTLLRVEVDSTPAGAEISWNSIAGRPQVVEFTPTLPPAWEFHTRTNGTGARMTVVDPNGGEQFRFYRVRVEYEP